MDRDEVDDAGVAFEDHIAAGGEMAGVLGLSMQGELGLLSRQKARSKISRSLLELCMRMTEATSCASSGQCYGRYTARPWPRRCVKASLEPTVPSTSNRMSVIRAKDSDTTAPAAAEAVTVQRSILGHRLEVVLPPGHYAKISRVEPGIFRVWPRKASCAVRR